MTTKRITSPPVICPHCNRTYFRNKFQDGACSTYCLNELREVLKLGISGRLKHPSWGKV